MSEENVFEKINVETDKGYFNQGSFNNNENKVDSELKMELGYYKKLVNLLSVSFQAAFASFVYYEALRDKFSNEFALIFDISIVLLMTFLCFKWLMFGDYAFEIKKNISNQPK